jgi:hypothetical protein
MQNWNPHPQQKSNAKRTLQNTANSKSKLYKKSDQLQKENQMQIEINQHLKGFAMTDSGA